MDKRDDQQIAIYQTTQLEPVEGRWSCLLHCIGDSGCDEDGQLSRSAHLPQGMGQDKSAQTVAVIGGQCDKCFGGGCNVNKRIWRSHRRSHGIARAGTLGKQITPRIERSLYLHAMVMIGEDDLTAYGG